MCIRDRRKWEFDIGWATIKGLQAVGLAKVLRVAPSLDVRPNIPVPDTDTLKALLTMRFQAVSYTHLDVYKRQAKTSRSGWMSSRPGSVSS